MSLRKRLALSHFIIALIVLVLVTIAINIVFRVSFAQLAAAQARREAQQLVRPVAAMYERTGSLSDIGRVLDRRQLPPDRRVLVATTDERIIFDSGHEKEGKQLLARERAQAVPINVRGQGQVGLLIVAPPDGGARGPLGQMEQEFQTRINRWTLLSAIIASAVAGLLGLLTARRLARPIQALTAAAHHVAEHGGGQQIALPVHSADEVGQLTEAFNTMSAELVRQEGVRRRMVADIAHELRTPLSVLRMELEALEDGISAPTPEVLGSLQEEVDLLNRLVDDLRVLSLAQAGQLSLDPAYVDSAELLTREAAQAQSRAQGRGISVALDLPPGMPHAWADPQRLAQILGNLVENALRYTPAGGSVVLTGASRPGEVWLTVRDSGPGIPKDDQARIFDRFYRTDDARARETGGSGLGLAIVRELAEAMGGRVWVDSEPGRGASFTIALPTAPAAPRPSAAAAAPH